MSAVHLKVPLAVATLAVLTPLGLPAQNPAPIAVQIAAASQTQAAATSSVIKTNITAQLTIGGGQHTGSVIAFTVPSGKRLVVEFVSSFVNLAAGDRVVTAGVNNAAVAPIYSFDNGFSSFSTISQPLRYYVNPGENLTFTVGRFYTTGDMTFPVTVTGYLEDAQ